MIDSSPLSGLDFDSHSSQYITVVLCRPDNSLSEEDLKNSSALVPVPLSSVFAAVPPTESLAVELAHHADHTGLYHAP